MEPLIPSPSPGQALLWALPLLLLARAAPPPDAKSFAALAESAEAAQAGGRGTRDFSQIEIRRKYQGVQLVDMYPENPPKRPGADKSPFRVALCWHLMSAFFGRGAVGCQVELLPRWLHHLHTAAAQNLRPGPKELRAAAAVASQFSST